MRQTTSVPSGYFFLARSTTAINAPRLSARPASRSCKYPRYTANTPTDRSMSVGVTSRLAFTGAPSQPHLDHWSGPVSPNLSTLPGERQEVAKLQVNRGCTAKCHPGVDGFTPVAYVT